MSSKSKDLSVGALARRAGVPVSTVHYYEAKGLIAGWRTSANHRRYDRAMLRRLAIVKAAQRLGVPLATIGRALAQLPKDRTPSAAEWAAMSSAWAEDLTRRIETLTKLRDQLDYCIGCGCLSIARCPLYNPDDALAAEGPGARRLDPHSGPDPVSDPASDPNPGEG